MSRDYGRITSTVVVALSGPARGPESNSTVRVIGSVDWDGARGTRTEAGQKVPQAKPERAPSIRPAAAEPRLIPAVGPSAEVPARPAVTINRPSPV